MAVDGHDQFSADDVGAGTVGPRAVFSRVHGSMLARRRPSGVDPDRMFGEIRHKALFDVIKRRLVISVTWF